MWLSRGVMGTKRRNQGVFPPFQRIWNFWEKLTPSVFVEEITIFLNKLELQKERSRRGWYHSMGLLEIRADVAVIMMEIGSKDLQLWGGSQSYIYKVWGDETAAEESEGGTWQEDSEATRNVWGWKCKTRRWKGLLKKKISANYSSTNKKYIQWGIWIITFMSGFLGGIRGL